MREQLQTLDVARPPAVSAVESHAAAREIDALLLVALDLERVVEPFAREIGRLAYASLVYQHDGQGVVYSLGAPARHSLAYRLTLSGSVLGELSLTRETPFSDGDIFWLENRIHGLVCALHGALSGREVRACPHESLPQRRVVNHDAAHPRG